MKLPFRLTLLLLLLSSGVSFSSAANVSLPLGGVYRAGRYMPLQISADAERGGVSFVATGALHTSVEVQPSTRVIAPWLMMSETVQNPAWTDPAGARHELTSPLHALNENDRLVALLGIDVGLAQSIFPDAHIVPIPLDVGWTPAPAAAWEALDAIVVAENNLPVLEPSLDTMLLAGTTIAVASQSAPAIHHNEWLHSGALWLLHRQPLISHDPINSEADGPTYDWIRGRTPVDRARILILAIIVSIAVVMIALWRSRWAGWLIVAVCIGGAFVVFAYDRQRPRMLGLRLGVTAAGQLDAWTWYSPIVASEARHPFSNLSKPVFASRRQSRELEVSLNWTEDPLQRAFTFHLERNQSMAFVDVVPAPVIEFVKPELFPDAKEFADHLYLRNGDRLAGTAVLLGHNSLTTVIIDRPHSPAPK